MLCIRRRKGQKIIIGDGPNKIEIVVIDWRANGVQIGIEAPENVAVNRQEIYEVVKRAGGDLTTRPSGG